MFESTLYLFSWRNKFHVQSRVLLSISLMLLEYHLKILSCCCYDWFNNLNANFYFIIQSVDFYIQLFPVSAVDWRCTIFLYFDVLLFCFVSSKWLYFANLLCCLRSFCGWYFGVSQCFMVDGFSHSLQILLFLLLLIVTIFPSSALFHFNPFYLHETTNLLLLLLYLCFWC